MNFLKDIGLRLQMDEGGMVGDLDKDGKMLGIGLKDLLLYKKNTHNWKESKWDKDTMLHFHNKIIGKLFIRDINERIKNFIMDIYFIQKIQKELNLPKIYYEDYEYDKKYLASCFDGIDKEHILKVSKICDKIIPYISKNYLDYYSKRTKLCVSEWKLDEL